MSKAIGKAFDVDDEERARIAASSGGVEFVCIEASGCVEVSRFTMAPAYARALAKILRDAADEADRMQGNPVQAPKAFLDITHRDYPPLCECAHGLSFHGEVADWPEIVYGRCKASVTPDTPCACRSFCGANTKQSALEAAPQNGKYVHAPSGRIFVSENAARDTGMIL